MADDRAERIAFLRKACLEEKDTRLAFPDVEWLLDEIDRLQIVTRQCAKIEGLEAKVTYDGAMLIRVAAERDALEAKLARIRKLCDDALAIVESGAGAQSRGRGE